MIGQTISHYKILEKLGEGGMGVVYKAEDTKLKRTVALKFLPPELTRNSEAKERFIHEAQAASALQHSNICTVHDIDETPDRQLFIVMDLYEGETLKKKIEQGSLPIDEAVTIASQMAQGLAKAHEAGIVHRDIKPANIMVTKDGVAKILDFGLAKVSGGTLLTKTGTTLGTAAYMSPEQARGEAIDRRTDIWSLGVTMYEMLTGNRPFESAYEQALVYSILNEEPKPMRDLRFEIPEAIEKICRRAMAKDVKDRYQTAAELITDLESCKTGTQLSQKTQRVLSKKPKFIYGGLVLILIAIAIIGIFRSTGKRETSPLAKKMLIVLPFDNLGAPSDDYFAEGLTDEVTSRLGMVNALGVISRTTAVQYRKTAKSTKQIGSECNVDYVLEGTMRWDHEGSGRGRVRVNLELIRAGDDVQIWSNAYERPVEDVFGVQTQITEEVMKQLDLTVAEPERQRIMAKPTSSQEAYDLYLKAQLYGRKADTTGSMDEVKLAINCLNQAVALDPNFALAYYHLSRLHSDLYYTSDHTEKRIAFAKESLDKVLSLDPDYGHLAAAWYYYRGFLDYDRALAEFDMAKHAFPNLHDALPAAVLRRQGKFEESISIQEVDFKYNPRDADVAFNIGQSYWWLRLYDKTIAWYDRGLSLLPDDLQLKSFKILALINWKGNTTEARSVLETMNHADTHDMWAQIFVLERNYAQALREFDSVRESSSETPVGMSSKDLDYARIYWFMGDSISMKSYAEKARKMLEEMLPGRPSEPRIHSPLGYAYAYLGKKDLAVEHGRRATELLSVSKDAFVGPSYLDDLARIYTIIGDKEEAIKILEYLQSIPFVFSAAWIKLDPAWDPLRDDPRFKKLFGEKGGK